MKATLLTIGAASLLALATPAFAQNAGAPGATGAAGCGLSGSNTGTCRLQGWNDNYGSGQNGYYRTEPGYLNEGRASAPDYDNGYGPRSDMEQPRVGVDVDGPRNGYDDAR